ncbi:hypothetical protein AOLI_G00151700 [Acnodon oligacanthus]
MHCRAKGTIRDKPTNSTCSRDAEVWKRRQKVRGQQSIRQATKANLGRENRRHVPGRVQRRKASARQRAESMMECGMELGQIPR